MSYSRRDLPLNALRAFEAVARTRSFTAAAESLNVAQSAISRHVARLEDILGRRLFDRAGKSVRLTQVGDHLYPIVQRSFDAMMRGMDQAGQSTELRLHVPPAFVQTVGLPFVQQFKDAHPGIPLTIMTTHAIGIPTADYDLAIIFDDVATLSHDRSLLWPIVMTPVCSVQSVDRIGRTGLAEALRSEELLHVRLEGFAPDHLWKMLAEQAGVTKIRASDLAFETAALAIEFARAGAGLALADTRMSERSLQAGGLAAPFDRTFDTGFGYFLVQSRGARRRAGSLELRRFIEQACS